MMIHGITVSYINICGPAEDIHVQTELLTEQFCEAFPSLGGIGVGAPDTLMSQLQRRRFAAALVTLAREGGTPSRWEEVNSHLDSCSHQGDWAGKVVVKETAPSSFVYRQVEVIPFVGDRWLALTCPVTEENDEQRLELTVDYTSRPSQFAAQGVVRALDEILGSDSDEPLFKCSLDAVAHTRPRATRRRLRKLLRYEVPNDPKEASDLGEILGARPRRPRSDDYAGEFNSDLLRRGRSARAQFRAEPEE